MESPVRPGGRVAHYQVLAEIGRGGMGVIFRARDSKLNRDVALKCPWPRLAADASVRERFLREARAASQLSHPNIVPIFQILNWSGLPWLAMELVEGSSLRALLKEQGPLPLRQSLACAEGLADALRAAHAKGIIHRDINPNNILVRSDGWPLLTDFGLARVFTSEAADPDADTASERLTREGHVVGTRGYMSPEQILGKPLDPRSDIFSLGAVLYEMCTGKRAFEGDTAVGANEAILNREPVAMSRIDGSVPEELERIVGKALAKRPEERHVDARELHSDLVSFRRQVESEEFAPPSARAVRARRRLAWAAGVAVVAAVAGLWIRALVSPARPLAGGTPRQVTSDPGCEAEPAVSPDGGLIAFTSMGAGSSDIWITDVRGASRLRLTDGGARNGSPAWFPDGTALAFVSDRGGDRSIWKVPRLGGTAVSIAAHGVDPAISPDGRRIAFARTNPAGRYRIVVAPLDDPSQVAWVTGDNDGERDHSEAAWSPDGRRICYTDTHNLWIVPLGGTGARQLTSENAGDREPVWSSDGRFVVFRSDREGTRALWRIAADGGSPQRLTVGTGPERHPSISMDGSKFVYSTFANDADIVLLDIRRGTKELVKSLVYDAAPSFSPDGSALVFTSSRRGGRDDLWTQPMSEGKLTGAPRPLTDLSGSVNTPAYSPDGKWVAFKREVSGGREIWVVPAIGGMPERFSDGSGRDLHPAWSPDGTWLAFVSERGAESHIWTAPIQQGRRTGPSRQITGGPTTDRLPTWSGDGRRIAYARGSADHWEVWTVPAGGGRPSGPIARATMIGRLRWDKPSGWLWFGAVVGLGETELRKVPPEGGEPVAALRADLFAEAAPPGDFDLSSDGRLLAFTRQQLRGDIWLVEDRRGSY